MSRNVASYRPSGEIEVDDADHVGRRLLDRHPVLLDLGRQAGLGRRHLVLDVDGGDVLVVADVERGDDVGEAVGGAVGVEVDQPLDAVDLLLDRGRDRVGDGLGVGAGVGRRDLDLGRHDVRVERDRQDEDADAADEQHQQGQHRGEDRAADEEVDHGCSRYRWLADRRRGSSDWRPGVAVGHGFRSRLSAASPRPGCPALAAGSGPGTRDASGGAGSALTVIPARTSCSPSTITSWPGFEARFEDAKALVGEGRPDRDDGHLALPVDGVDGRTGLGLDHGLLGDDDRVLGLADLDVGLHVLAGQDRLLRVGDLRLDQEGGGRRVDRVVDDGRLAGEAAGLLPLEAGPEDLDREPLGDQPRHPVEVAGRRPGCRRPSGRAAGRPPSSV